MNGGNYVLTPFSGITNVYNMGVAFGPDNNTMYALIEAKNGVGGTFDLYYAYTNLTELNFTAHASGKVISLAGNPHMKYDNKTDSLFVITGDGYTGSNYWKIRPYYASLTDNLSSSASWKRGNNFEISWNAIHASDPDMANSDFNMSNNLIFDYNYNQADIYIEYSNLSFDNFYKLIKSSSVYTPAGYEYFHNSGLTMITGSDTAPIVFNQSLRNYTLTVDSKIVSGVRIGIIWAYANSTYLARTWTSDASTTYYQEKINGVWGNNINLGANNANSGWHEWKGVKEGNQFTLYIDGTKIGSTQTMNAALNTNTKIGFQTHLSVIDYRKIKVVPINSVNPVVSSLNYIGSFMPPSPINLTQVNNSLTWVNHTWEAGSGNVTDSFNVSVNGTWTNGSSNIFYNHTGLSSGTWSNISVYSWNSTGSGSLNLTPVSQNIYLYSPTATYILNGTVNNSLGAPVEWAKVTWDSNSVFSNESGFYEFTNASSGSHTLTAQHVGYATHSEVYDLASNTTKNITLSEKETVSEETAINYSLVGAMLGGLLAFVLLRKKRKDEDINIRLNK